MAEYIEREAVLAEADYDGNFNLVIPAKKVRNIPAADVVPVVHGEWKHFESGWFDLWRCSACGDEWTFEYDPTDKETMVNFCPNCGAKMDGERKDGADG